MLDQPELPTTAAGSSQPPATLAFLGAPPLVEGERVEAYDELLARISGALQPADILEDIWIRDIVDLVWEVFRLRRLKAHLMTARARDGMREQVQRLLIGGATEVTTPWAAHDDASRKTVDAALAAAGVSVEDVTARSLSLWISDFERIERMIMTAEARRHAALRELDRHRATLARTLRRTIADVEDAEFKVIAPETPARDGAA